MYNPYYTASISHKVYHRGPTPYEIRFGEGATHYCEIPYSVCKKLDGSFKQWCVFGGLRYYAPQ